jgi:signal transduction histidine kinase
VIVSAHDPRVRAEWLIAVARLTIAAGTLVASGIAPDLQSRGVIIYLAAWYLFYSLGMLALVWAPIKFARGWDVAVQAFDLGAFSVLVVVSDGATTPFVTSVTFLLVCGVLRWQLTGLLWMSLAVLVVYGVSAQLSVEAAQGETFPWQATAMDLAALAATTTVLACLTLYYQRYQAEIGRLATWPRTIAQDQRETLSEIISRSAELLGSPQVLLVWREAEEGVVNLAWGAGDGVEWVREAEEGDGTFVAPDLAERSFQAADASDEHGRVVILAGRGFRRAHRRPIDEALRGRFNMRAVQSSPLIGEIIRGRMFFLDQPRQRLDHLMLGEVVARLAAVRLDSFYAIQQIGESVTLKERIRVARDLHDSLLQSQAGAALQLMAARRMLERDPEGAKRSLEAIQQQLERGELEMRSFIRGLRPLSGAERAEAVPFHERMQDLRRRLERQWHLKVEISSEPAVDALAADLSEQLFRLVQEGIVNAARHADASVVRIHLSHAVPGQIRIRIADDGKGFPFQGTYDLAALGAMNKGPLTLRERVTELNGALTLTSTGAGSELLIVLPLAHA